MKYNILFFTFLIQLSFSFGQEKLTEIISKSEKAVCLIRTFDKNKELKNIGTGFFIDSIGTCVSNYHVLKDYEVAEIITHDGKTYKIEKTLKSSSEFDIIVFKIQTDTVLDFLQVQKTLPEKGENILVIGNPIGLEWSVSEGIISSVRKISVGNVLQITAPISPGNSGSPVLDYHGNVIGIVTFLMNEGQNLNFALHISVLDSVHSNIALFENPLSKSAIPNDFKIAKNHIDKLVPDTGLFLNNKVPQETIINYIEQFIKSYPASYYGYMKKGDFYKKLWESEKAIEFYSKAINIESNIPEVYKKRALALQSTRIQENISSAINDFKKYGTFSDEFLIESYAMIASCYREMNKDNLAIEYYSKYIDGNLEKGNTDISNSYVNRALLYWRLDKFDLANQDFDEAIKLSPTCYAINWKVDFLLDYEKYNEASKIYHDSCICNTAGHYYDKALILMKIDGDMNNAEYYINKSIGLAEEYVSNKIIEEIELEQYYRLRAIIFYINENYVDGLRDLNNILRINPSLKSDYTISKWIVDIKFQLNDYLGCLKDLNSLIESNPDKPDLFEMKGLTLSNLNDEIGAIKAFSKAIELKPQDGRFYRLRGLSKYYSDDKSGACSDWSKAGELGEFKAYEHIKEYCNY